MLKCLICDSDYEFYGQRRKICRPCKREYEREYHKKRSPEKISRKVSLQKERLDIARQYVWDYLKLNPCVSCGESDPVVLEFDHIDRESKIGNIAEMKYMSIRAIQTEIDKCRVLCANCHRKHTANQLGWYKNILNVA